MCVCSLEHFYDVLLYFTLSFRTPVPHRDDKDVTYYTNNHVVFVHCDFSVRSKTWSNLLICYKIETCKTSLQHCDQNRHTVATIKKNKKKKKTLRSAKDQKAKLIVDRLFPRGVLNLSHQLFCYALR